MGIFDNASDLFKRYHAQIVFRDKVMGGTPKSPKIIEGWLRSKAGITDVEELRQATLRTLVELGVDMPEAASYEDMAKAIDKLAAVKQTNGFKAGDQGLYIESRTIKAMLKESTNILFAGQRWGVTKKGPRSFLAERVFVSPDRIFLGRTEPDGIETFIGHVSGPQGPQSTLTYVEYVQGATIEFDVLVAEDCIQHEDWPRIWVHAQLNGLGALRSQGFGTFDLEQWEQCTGKRCSFCNSEADSRITRLA